MRRSRDLVAESDRLRNTGSDEYATADFSSAAFDPGPTLLAGCIDPRRHQFLAQLLGTPKYHALHAGTRLDDIAAGLAADLGTVPVGTGWRTFSRTFYAGGRCLNPPTR